MRPSTGRRREGGRITEALYEGYALAVDPYSRRSGRIRPSWCNRRPWPRSRRPSPATGRICRRTSLRDGLLSDAQLESVIYAGEAHAAISPDRGPSTRPSMSSPPRPTTPTNAVRFRRGWFLGDGTGAGKGRQVAGILLDNWLQGPPPRGLGLQIRQADRGRAARLVGARQERLLDHAALALPAGHADPARPKASSSPPMPRCAPTSATSKVSRVQQIVDWLGCRLRRRDHLRRKPCHAERRRRARANAATRPPRSRAAPGCACSTRCPNARVVYVSATGATTVHNLAYAQRLGLWGGDGLPLRHARRVRRGDRGRRRRGDGGAGARPEGARPLCGPLALL